MPIMRRGLHAGTWAPNLHGVPSGRPAPGDADED